ncbi:MAG TPA: hypothetical protein PKE55_03000 [Kiritimatiellia bacterium]|nr:hypothetical protein [Kiritimatiellia bacterium]
MKHARWLVMVVAGWLAAGGIADTGLVVRLESRGLMVADAEWMATGLVHVVVFHASWDVPSREVLERLPSLRLDTMKVRVVAMDVVDPRTQIARQNRVSRLPDIRIRLADGEWLETSVHGLDELERWLKELRLLEGAEEFDDGSPDA